jgi:hypothetical protein
MGIKQAWHGLTIVQQEITFKGSPLDWTLDRQPLILADGTRFHQDAIVCSDDGLPVGNAVSGSYGIIQNEQLFDTLMAGLEDASVKFKVASVGSVCDRAKVFISIELNEGKSFKVGDRDFEFNLNALSSHDGSGKAMFMDSSICIVCKNTFNFNVNQFNNKKGGIRFAVKHTKNSGIALENVAKGIEDVISNRALFCAELDKLGNQKVSKDDAHSFILGLIVPETSSEVSTRTNNNSEEILDLFIKGPGNSGSNRLDLFSAFTDFYTHSHSGRGVEAQFVSSEFGSGQKMKDRAFHALSNSSTFDNLKKRGSSLVLSS